MRRRYDPREPNASYYSARYAERKRAADRARDIAAGPSPCLHCSANQGPGSIFCELHQRSYDGLLAEGRETGDYTKALAYAATRTYWP